MENDLRTRIQYLIKTLGTSVSQIAGGNGTTLQVKLNRQINGDTAISANTIFIVLQKFPNVSAEWLLRGDGEMLKTNTPSHSVNMGTMTGGQVQVGGNNTITGDASMLLAEKDARIAELEKDKEFLSQLLHNLTSK